MEQRALLSSLISPLSALLPSLFAGGIIYSIHDHLLHSYFPLFGFCLLLFSGLALFLASLLFSPRANPFIGHAALSSKSWTEVFARLVGLLASLFSLLSSLSSVLSPLFSFLSLLLRVLRSGLEPDFC